MDERILLVDDDPMLLHSHRRSLREFSIETACGAWEALGKVLGGQPYAVIVSDLRMPEIDGLSLLRRVHETSPNTIKMILTGNPDLKTAIGAVNDGIIFRYLEKPCPVELLVEAVQAGVQEYRRIASQKALLAKAAAAGSTLSVPAAPKRGPLGSGDQVVVAAEGMRQGQQGIIEEVLPSLGGNETYQVCIVEFPSLPGSPKERYFVKELTRVR